MIFTDCAFFADLEKLIPLNQSKKNPAITDRIF
jgi:hypothetical protein